MFSFLWDVIARFLHTHRRCRVWFWLTLGLLLHPITGMLFGQEADFVLALLMSASAAAALAADYFAWRHWR